MQIWGGEDEVRRFCLKNWLIKAYLCLFLMTNSLLGIHSGVLSKKRKNEKVSYDWAHIFFLSFSKAHTSTAHEIPAKRPDLLRLRISQSGDKLVSSKMHEHGWEAPY